MARKGEAEQAIVTVTGGSEAGRSLVPLLTLGISGAPPAAVLLRALLFQGMRLGVELYTVHAEITYTFLFSLFVANIVMLPIGIYGGRAFPRLITVVPMKYLAPTVAFLTIIGSYAIRPYGKGNGIDVGIVFFNVLVRLIGSKKKSISSIALSLVVVGCIVSVFYFIFKEILLVPLSQGVFF